MTERRRKMTGMLTISMHYIYVLILLPVLLSVAGSDSHGRGREVDADYHAHPFKTMVVRASELNPIPITFYGENGRVHMEYQPIIPKVLYTVSVIGELMRGVGSTVQEVLHRASVGYPGSHYGTFQAPYYYSHPKAGSSSLSQHQEYAHYPRQYGHYPQHYGHHHIQAQQRNPHQVQTTTKSSQNVPPPIQISLASQIHPRYVRPPVTVPRPPSPPQQNILEVFSAAMAGA